MQRRSFFRSLALLGAAAVGFPGVFVPKFEPSKWKVVKLKPADEMAFGGTEYHGKWTFIIGTGLWAPYESVIKPCGENEIGERVLHIRTDATGAWESTPDLL